MAAFSASKSVFEPTGRANARPMTGSVGTGSREENASKQKTCCQLQMDHPEAGGVGDDVGAPGGIELFQQRADVEFRGVN
jgi:hypothetical protein